MAKKQPKKPVPQAPALVERWAICQYYLPFTMGGSVWQFRRFKVQAKDIQLVGGFRGFVFLDTIASKGLQPHWKVYEITTGGLLGEGKTEEDAIYDANHNIKITPDLKQQMEQVGNVMQHQEVPTEEALRRCAKDHGSG